MFGKSYTLLRVWGIPIRLHISLVLIVPILLGSFGFSTTALSLGVGVLSSITLHELGHCFIAIRRGCGVREILLTPIGGAAQMTDIPRRPLDEMLMAAAGPAVSVVLGGLFFLGGLALPVYPIAVLPIQANDLLVLGVVNFWLVIFNLIPAFPMDGGRVLRALLALKLPRLRATFYASRVGQGFAILFGLRGIGFLFQDFVSQGLVLLAIAVLVFRAARNEYLIVRQQEGPIGPGLFTAPPPPPEQEVVIGPSPYDQRARKSRAHVSEL